MENFESFSYNSYFWSVLSHGHNLWYCLFIINAVYGNKKKNQYMIEFEPDQLFCSFFFRSNWSSQNRIHTSDSQTWTRMLLEILENEKLLQHQNHVSFILYMCFKNALRFHGKKIVSFFFLNFWLWVDFLFI